MADLIVICATRGRPANALRLQEAVAATSRAATSLLFLADDDDPSAAQLAERGPVGISVRASISVRVNAAALHLAADPDIKAIGWMNDHMVPRTPGWDEILLRDLLGKPGMAWPECLRRPGFPEAIIMSREIVTALGWMMEPSMRHYYVDEVWNDLARATGCGGIDSRAVVEDIHPDPDATHAETRAFARLDGAAYRRWWRERMPADAAKIREVAR